MDIHTHHVQMLTLMRGFAPPQRAKRKEQTDAHLQESLFGDL
jgi:hypothetical protein